MKKFSTLKINFSSIITVLFIFLLPLIIFRESFSVYFFQDDFFAFSISQVSKIADTLRFFIPRNDVQFYRPLSTEFYYLINKSIFGLNPIPFHLVGWVIFIINIFLVYQLSGLFLKKKISQAFLAVFYGTSSIHYDSLFWIANFSYILVTAFYFLAFYLYKSRLRFKNIYMLILFVFGLLSNELMITFPFIIIIDLLIKDKKIIKGNLLLIIVFIFLTVCYLFLRFILFMPNTDNYKFSISTNVFSTLRFYILFLFNFPETIKDYMVNFYTIRADFIKFFPLETVIFMSNLIIFSALMLIYPLFHLIKNSKISYITRNLENLIFSVIWFIVTLLPVIFILVHFSPHYAGISLFGFLLFFMIIFESIETGPLKSILMSTATFCWFVSSINTVNLNNRIHWIARRSILSKYWISAVKKEFPSLKSGSNVYIPVEEKEVLVSLNDGKAINIIYDDPSLKVLFQERNDNKITIK